MSMCSGMFELFHRDRRKNSCSPQDSVGQLARLNRVEKVQSSMGGTSRYCIGVRVANTSDYWRKKNVSCQDSNQ